MKKIIFGIAMCIFSLGVVAQQDDKQKQEGQKPLDQESNIYCAKLKDGIMVIMEGDKPINKEIVLSNGTRITMDGTVIKMDGTKMVLKEEECVDQNGERVKKQK
jgi:hypothetical protein